MVELIYELKDCGDKDTSLVGGKALSLGRLIQAGFAAPPGFVITTETNDKMSIALQKDIFAYFDRLGSELVAVRSTAVAEDGANDAWAGQMDSFLNVERKEIITSIKKCWDSATSQRAKAYAKQKGLAAGKLAVIVQRMIHGDVSGVAFSVHPVSKNPNHMIIEAVEGLAESLVSGTATPDSYIVNKKDGKIVKKAAPESLLSNKQVAEVADSVKRLEKYFKFPVDVEWTISSGKLYILQSRPITTLS